VTTIDFPVKSGSALAPPSDALVARFEQVHRVHLPAPFVDLLRTANGGIPVRPCLTASRRERFVERFLCLLDDYKNVDGQNDMRVVITQLEGRIIVDGDALGTPIIPVAALFGDDFVCLDFRENRDAPTVCIWFHEESTVFHPVTETIAPSFDAFLAMMHDGTRAPT
jgi:hypothetical protein